jgi:hypothetical protein
VSPPPRLASFLRPLRLRRVFAVYLQFGDQHQAAGLKELRRQVKRLLPRSPASFLVIDNALPAAAAPVVNGDVTLLAGDNSNREFSGWDHGLAWLRVHREVASTDVVLLANDTFHRSYGTEYLQLFRPAAVGWALRRNALVGYMDAFPEPVQAFGRELRSWVRTSFVITTASTLYALLPLQLGQVDAQVFSSTPGQFFHPDAPLSDRYQAYLQTWLFGERVGVDGFRERWHGQAGLTEANGEAMRQKARCIFAEHQLSARARALGVPVVDVRGVRYAL